MPQQVGQPLAVADVGLAPRHRLDVPGVDQQQLEPGPPAGSRSASNRRRCSPWPRGVHPCRRQPVRQRQDVWRSSSRRPGSPACGSPSVPGSPGRPPPPLVHVQPAAARIHHVHGRPSLQRRRASGVLATLQSLVCVLPCRERQSVVPRSTQGPTVDRARGTRRSRPLDARAVRASVAPRRPFHPSMVPRRAISNC